MTLILHRALITRACTVNHYILPFVYTAHRSMATVNNGFYKTHTERTAAEPRRPSVHQVELSRVDQINDSVRLLRLKIADQTRGIEVSAIHASDT